MNLALFDFDGTITSRDSFLQFLWYADRSGFMRTSLTTIPQILLYKLNLYPNQMLKERFLTDLFQGKPLTEMQIRAEQFTNDLLPAIIRDGFWARLNWHRDNGDTIVVVSATPSFLLSPWCTSQNIDLIGTEVELDQQSQLTGRIDGRNCMGEEKVLRIKACYNLEDFQDLYVYGDSSGDLAMLELALPSHRFYKPFR